jgi:hypothetical protein
LLQVVFGQRPKDHYLVDPVHEFRRKLVPRRFDGRALNLLLQVRVILWLGRSRGREADASGNEFLHLTGAQV